MSWIQSAFGPKTSPVIIFIIILLAIVIFIAALIRFLLKNKSQPSIPETSPSGTFQRQLQQLFHLHDSGLDQNSIDTLPVFLYKDVVGSKEPFDCAVCLCEFTELDKLRLLPLCSHAFHVECIDTWLLSNSTCPLCRGVIPSTGFSFENPVFYLEDDGGGFSFTESDSAVISEKRVFSVRLGKLRSVNNGGVNGNFQESEIGEGSSGNLGSRRCYSMGSFQYVVADSELQVALRREKGGERGGQNGNFTSVGGGDSDGDGKKIGNGAKGESFSVSKIWLWSKKGKIGISTNTHYCNAINVGLP